ncbi:MAG: metal ABC transporter permease [Pirellulales bacterium]
MHKHLLPLADSLVDAISHRTLLLVQHAAHALGVEYNTLLVLMTAALLGGLSGVIGCFAVLRRRALVGDALAHAALPGLCLAFLVAGVRSVPVMLLGALASGVLGILVIVALRRWTRIKEDAAIGIVLSVFFGAGIVLSSWIQNSTVTGNKAGLDSYILGKTSGIQAIDLVVVAVASLICIAIVAAAFKEFRLVTFDAPFARAQGWPTALVDLTLLGMIAVVVVIGLPTVGVVLMAALLIIPGAAARFWTERLSVMTLLSAAIGLTVGIVGAAASAKIDRLPTGPIIVLVGTAVFLISATMAPRRGAISRWLQGRRFARRIAVRRLIGELYEAGPDTNRDAWRAGERRAAWSEARRRGYVESSPHGNQLTDSGRAAALAALRDERLWQTVLVEYPELAVGAADPFHAVAADVLPKSVVDELVARLQAAGRWPEELRTLVSPGGSR